MQDIKEALKDDVIMIDKDPSLFNSNLLSIEGRIAVNSTTNKVFIYTKTGENNFIWRCIGTTPPIIKSTESADQYECPNCKTHSAESLHVHHIDRNPKNNNSDNLITLCRSCHVHTHLFIKKGLSNDAALSLIKELGSLYQKNYFVNIKTGLSKREEIESFIRNTFIKEGIRVTKTSFYFHKSKKRRLYCEVDEIDFDYIKKLCKENDMTMQSFVFSAIVESLERIKKEFETTNQTKDGQD